MMSPFEELLAKLARAKVRFVVVGGVAVLMQGFPRATQDVDILVEASEENARRLIAALTDWGEGSAKELELKEFALPQLGPVRVAEDFDLDIFTLMRARGLDRELSFEEVAADAPEFTLSDGSNVRFASIGRLLDFKAGTGRHKDQIDTEVLTEIARGLCARVAGDLTRQELGPTTDGSLDQGDRPLALNEPQ